MHENGLRGSDYMLVALAIIAVILMFVLFAKADQIYNALAETTSMSPLVYLPLVVGGQEMPEPRPTLTANPRPTLESQGE